jgi:ABC-type transport system substrate-binding protein
MHRLALLLASVMAMAACSRTPAPPCDASQPRTLRIAMADSRGHAASFAGSTLNYLTTPSLVWVDQHGRPAPGLARSWEKSDPRTWTFRLQPNLRSHNGKMLTATRLREALLALASTQLNFFHDLDTIDVPAADAVVMRFKRPFNLLPEALATTGLAPGVENPELSTGPWRVTPQTRDDQMELVAFPSAPSADHLPGTPTRLLLTRYPDMRSAWAAFLRNELDFMLEVPLAAVPSLSENPDIRLYIGAASRNFTFGFRRQAPALRDVRVRQAINLAIDREAIVRRLYGGYPPLLRYAKPIAGPFSPEYWAMTGAESLWPYDPAKARALLKAATGSGDPIEIQCLTSNEFPEIAEMAAIVEAQLRRVHIRLRLEPVAYKEMIARLASGDFDSYVLPMAAGFTGTWAYIHWHGDSDNPAPRFGRNGYDGADAALDRLYTADSPDAERAAVRDVMEAMHRDPPAAFLVANPVVRGVRSTWRVPEDDIDIRHSVHSWKLDHPCGTF